MAVWQRLTVSVILSTFFSAQRQSSELYNDSTEITSELTASLGNLTVFTALGKDTEGKGIFKKLALHIFLFGKGNLPVLAK